MCGFDPVSILPVKNSWVVITKSSTSATEHHPLPHHQGNLLPWAGAAQRRHGAKQEITKTNRAQLRHRLRLRYPAVDQKLTNACCRG